MKKDEIEGTIEKLKTKVFKEARDALEHQHLNDQLEDLVAEKDSIIKKGKRRVEVMVNKNKALEREIKQLRDENFRHRRFYQKQKLFDDVADSEQE